MLGEIVGMLEERALDGAAQLDGATAWLDRMKPLTAGHFVRWLPPSYRNAMALVDGVRARHGLELDRRPRAAPSFTRTARDAGLHDREPDPKEPQILGERAARERARREHELAYRRVDARALIEVHREAASRGEVSLGRFNAAYRRLHPAFDPAERRRRALVLTHRGRRIEATVRGPHGVEFSISRPADTDERVVVAALLYRIEMVVGRSAGQPTARAVDPTPKDTKDTHEPNLDGDALAQEPGAHAATTGLAEPEAIAAVMREIEQLTSSLFARPKPDATDTTPGSEDEENAGAVEEGLQAGELVDAKELTVEGKAAPLLTQASPSEAPPCAAEDRASPAAEDQASPQGISPWRPPPTRRAAIVRRAGPWRDLRACQRGHGIVHQARAPPRTRQPGDGQAWRGRSRPR